MCIRQITITTCDFFSEYLKPSSPNFEKRLIQISALAISILSFLGFLATQEPAFLFVSLVSLFVGVSIFSDSPSYHRSSYTPIFYAPPSYAPPITHHIYHQVPVSQPPILTAAPVYRPSYTPTYSAPTYSAPDPSYDLASRGSLHLRQMGASAVLPTASLPLTHDLAERGTLRRRP
jgi:hypothetical protein